MTDDVRILTRQELFDLVWSIPVQEAAASFGISDRGLAKICLRHRVPSPSRGYWARVQAGQKLKQPMLPKIDNPHLESIYIRSIMPHLKQDKKDVLRKIEEQQALTDKNPSTSLDIESLEAQKVDAKIEKTAMALRKNVPDGGGLVCAIGEGLCGIKVHKDRVERTVLIIHMLSLALQKEGLFLEPDGQQMKVSIGEDSVTFCLREITRRQKHIPTDEETKRYERYELKRERAHKNGDWSLSFERFWPDFDYIATGKLVFEFNSYKYGMRKSWSDGKRQTIESSIPQIILSIKMLLETEKLERARAREAACLREEYERRAKLAKRRQVREDDRLAYLLELKQLDEKLKEMRLWVDTLKQKNQNANNRNLSCMIEWAEKYISEQESNLSIENISEKIVSKNLFPEIDSLYDPLGDP